MDLITARILQELPRTGIVMLTYIFNATLCLNHIPRQWKTAKVIMLLKPGKALEEPKSYRPILLLPVITKLYEKLFIKRLRPVIEELGILPDYQFGFRPEHSIVEQMHRVAHTIRTALEKKQFYPEIFLDVSQAFVRVWIENLLHKVSQYLPAKYTWLLQLYRTDRTFCIQHGEAILAKYSIRAGVPQGSMLGP